MLQLEWFTVLPELKRYQYYLVAVNMTVAKGSLYSVDWTTGLDYWTGILD